MTRCGQLNQLIARDMVVTDRKRALNYLERIGYCRFPACWRNIPLSRV